MASNAQKRYSKIITLRVSKDLDEVLTKACEEFGYSSKSEFVREAVEDYVNYLLSIISDDEAPEFIDAIQVHKVIMI